MNVSILGDSLTSLILAKTLINKKVKVNMYYSKENSINKDTRTIGISSDNINFIKKEIIKIDKKFLWDIDKIEIFDDFKNDDKILNFNKSREKLFHIIKNKEFYKLLSNSLKKNTHFKKIKLKDNSIYEKIIKRNNPNLIINCDKKNIVYKKYFDKKFYKDYDSIAYSCIIKHSKIRNNKAIQVFTKYGPIAFLPISSYETSVVYSIKNFKDKSKVKLCEKKFNELVSKNNKIYKIKKIYKFKTFKLEFKISRNYYHKNILLFGDGLHQIHPLAGQGFNMTLRDLKVLIDIIKDKKDLGLPIDESVNLDFENKVKHLNFIFANGVDFFYEFFSFENYYFKFYSNYILKKLNKNKTFKNLFINFANSGFKN
jgi:2-octaprenyl-6-methoxyphenol hydroxylase